LEEVIVSELADVSDDDTDEEDGNTEGAFNKIFVEKARNRDDDPDESTTDMAIKIVMDLGGSNCHPAFQERLPWLLTFYFLIFWVGLFIDTRDDFEDEEIDNISYDDPVWIYV
jgi:hypothetical protein